MTRMQRIAEFADELEETRATEREKEPFKYTRSSSSSRGAPVNHLGGLRGPLMIHLLVLNHLPTIVTLTKDSGAQNSR